MSSCLSAVIYPFSYWTVQMATSDEDPRSVRMLNRLGQDLQSSGFAKVARAVDPMPQVWYDSADLAGLIYNNPLIEARLARYPAFLGLAERPEFQDMANDTQFTELLLRAEADHDAARSSQGPGDDPESRPAEVDLDHGGPRPAKTCPPSWRPASRPSTTRRRILGRWTFNVNVAMGLFRRAKPNISSTEMQKWKKWMVVAFAKTSFVAMTDHQAILKNMPQLKLPAAGRRASQRTANPQGPVEGPGWQVSTHPVGRKPERSN